MAKYFVSCFLLMLFYGNGSFAQVNTGLLSKEINITVENGSLATYFALITAQGVPLSYSSSQFNLHTKVKVKKGRYKTADLLQLLLAKEQIRFLEQGNKIVLFPAPVKPGKEYKLSGFVYFENSSEAIPYATIKVLANKLAIAANDYGFYQFQLKPGTYVLEISHIGYAPQNDTLTIKADLVKDFHLRLKAPQRLSDVEVSLSENPFGKASSVYLNENLNLPFVLGQQDPLKSIQFKAGVSGGITGGNMYVRGGSQDQNLVLLDGVPVYNYNHFGGLVSIFNADIVKHIDFYSGSFPARYEGRLSSVIDVKTKEGNMQEYHGALNAGLLTNSAMFEGPLIKNRLSFIASARRSWIDGLVSLFDRSSSGFQYYLYDVNVKINYKVDSTSRIYLSGYFGSDRFNLDFNETGSNAFRLNWGNKLIAARWSKVHHSRLFQNSSLLFSSFTNRLNDGGINAGEQFNRIIDVGINNDLTYQWSNNLQSFFGLRLNFASFGADANHFSGQNATGSEKQKSIHLKLYTDNDFDISDKVKLKAGLHYTAFMVKNKTYHSFQPRTTLSYSLNAVNRFFASYAFMAQFYHQISLSGISVPNEFRAPSSADLPPEQSIVYELSYRHTFATYGGVSFVLYRKNLSNILMYRLDENFLPVDDGLPYADRVITGTGISKGFETEYRQKFNRLTLHASYTLAKTTNSFMQINAGRPFKAPTDIRNQFTAMVMVDFGKRWSLSGVFNYSTGRLLTLPQAESDDTNPPGPNNHQLADNFNVDLGAVNTRVYQSGRQGILRFGINNIIGNPVPLFLNTSMEEDGQFQINQLKSVKFLPYIGYSFRF